MPANELTAAEILATGEIEIEMRMPYSSNATFLVRVTAGEHSVRAIYKPLRGERPLWDFAPGLHRREVAAYRLATAMGLEIVPLTLLRDGPIGEGSVQLLIDADFEQHYFTLHEQRPDLHPKLREMAVFDILANNTDRKSGHVLIDAGDNIWGIDHGLCFSADFKLRTVIWEFGGEEIAASLLAALHNLAGLADLVRIRHPTCIDDGTRSARCAVQQFGEFFDEPVVL
ncbi:MAG: SCO1664 family protein [Actinobacteria bacterium]|nr:SCO1664 family protein [Actinomycetota bacterium]